jgi:flotillin
LLLPYLLFCNLSHDYFSLQRCPSDKILVIYGRTGGTSAKCIHGGGAFIWPVVQDYQYLDLKPLSIEANLTNALSRQKHSMFLAVLP